MTRPSSWIALFVASALCTWLAIANYATVFPILDLDVRMSRSEAIAGARDLNARLALSLPDLPQSAAAFDDDSAVQTFVELEGGGKDALKPLLGNDEHVLHHWRVRLFKPSTNEEVTVWFTPAGTPNGFQSRIPEAQAGAAIDEDAARAIAVDRAERQWNVDFHRYKPVSASSVQRPGGRIDHEFRYERTDMRIGEGKLRLALTVSGDRLTGLQREFEVPEAFSRRFEEVRSSNNTIAAVAAGAAGLLYGLCGCVFGAVWLIRRKLWQWKTPAIWGTLVAALGAAATLAALPSSWFAYDTATPVDNFLVGRVLLALAGLLVGAPLLTLVFAVAEGLGRAAFGDHPQLWQAWKRGPGSSRQILGRTLGGYAWIGFDLAFIAAFYYVTQNWLGWWSPSESLSNPDILGNSQPWLPPVANALQAGFMEECLFRAVPLAGAALIGRRFGRERLFVVIALVLQAIIFGSAHANYPTEPAYARPVELFLPALIWGIVYLLYGLIPGIIFHFGFDLTLMSMPLFVTAAPGIVIDRALVVVAFLVPLAVVLWRRYQARGLTELDATALNGASSAEAARELAAEHVAEQAATAAAMHTPAARTPAAIPSNMTRAAYALLLALGIAGAIGFGLRLAQHDDAPGLSADRQTAIRAADAALDARGVYLGPEWIRQVRTHSPTDDDPHRFVWKESGPAIFAALSGSYLAQPEWTVRFVRFQGDVTERAENWRVNVTADGAVRSVFHNLPEGRAGKRLERADARAVADGWIRTWLGIAPQGLRLVSAEATERPQRLDWEISYQDTSQALKAGGEARIVVQLAGDEVVGYGRYVFVPDAWQRDERARNDQRKIMRIVAGIFMFILAAVVIVLAVRMAARRQFSGFAGVAGGLLVALQVLVGFGNNLPVAAFRFSSAQPLFNQYLAVGLGGVMSAALAGSLAALFIGLGVRYTARALAMRPTADTAVILWRDALGLALPLAGFAGWLSLLPQDAPRWPDVSAAAAFLPGLGNLLDAAGYLTTCGAAITLAVMMAFPRGWRAWVSAIALTLTVAALSSIDAESAFTALAVGALAGLGCYGLFRRFIMYRIWILPPVVLLQTLLLDVRHLFQAGYAGATPGIVVGAASTIAGLVLWSWLVRRDRQQLGLPPSA